ncbi:hypothetical protein [Formosa sp. S-31]|uniref:hypothetical protein n=1 Tax=Formosa sp. S-31 TaxID=2790949 RepID=UPI003EC130EE
MNSKDWAELLKYASPKSILVVNAKNRVIELKCPFKVETKHDIGCLKKAFMYDVESVKISTTMKTVFVIKGEVYYYHHFYILV